MCASNLLFYGHRISVNNPLYVFTNRAPGELSALFSVIQLNSFPFPLKPFDLPIFLFIYPKDSLRLQIWPFLC